MSKEELKAALTDSLYGTERGLKADSDTRAEIEELITQLEGKNPTALPNEVRAAAPPHRPARGLSESARRTAPAARARERRPPR